MNQYNNMMLNRINKQQIVTPNNINGQSAQNKSGESFGGVLDKKINELQFSKHANTRIHARQINLTPDQMNRVESGVAEAKAKGIKDSLVLVDGIALLVNINSRTVVTAMNSNQKNVFTNIDGAVIV